MARSKNLNSYDNSFWEEVVNRTSENGTSLFKAQDPTEAMNIALDFYGWRNALLALVDRRAEEGNSHGPHGARISAAQKNRLVPAFLCSPEVLYARALRISASRKRTSEIITFYDATARRRGVYLQLGQDSTNTEFHSREFAAKIKDDAQFNAASGLTKEGKKVTFGVGQDASDVFYDNMWKEDGLMTTTIKEDIHQVPFAKDLAIEVFKRPEEVEGPSSTPEPAPSAVPAQSTAPDTLDAPLPPRRSPKGAAP